MADEKEINSGIYAILADGDIVYVGQSQHLVSRMRSHLTAIAKGCGLARRLPSVFAGKIVSARVLECLEHGERPENPRRTMPRSDPGFKDREKHFRDCCRRARILLMSKELHYIQLHQPVCNKHGRCKPIRLQTIADIESMRVETPGKGRQPSTALSITA